MPAAYGAILRVEAAEQDPRMQFNAERADALYTHSPAVRELKPHLNIDSAAEWRQIGCENLHLDPCPVGIAAGWFVWALREAAADAGHFGSAPAAQRYFQRIADEMNAACNAGAIRCGPERVTMAPALRSAYVVPWLRAWLRGVPELLRFGAGDEGWQPAAGSLVDVIAFSERAGRLPTVEAQRPSLLVTGWAASPAPIAELRVSDAGTARPDARVTMAEAEFVEALLLQQGRTGMSAVTFAIETDCDHPGCAIEVSDPSGATESLDYPGLNAPGSLEAGEVLAYFTHVVQASEVFEPLDGARLEPLFSRIRTFAWGYALCFRVLALLIGPAPYLAGRAALRDPSRIGVATVLLASCTAVATRLALLAYIDVSSFDAFISGYLMPATPFAIVAIVLSAGLVARAMRGRTESAPAREDLQSPA